MKLYFESMLDTKDALFNTAASFKDSGQIRKLTSGFYTQAAQSSYATWEDGVPVIKSLSRQDYDSAEFKPGKLFAVDIAHGDLFFPSVRRGALKWTLVNVEDINNRDWDNFYFSDAAVGLSDDELINAFLDEFSVRIK